MLFRSRARGLLGFTELNKWLSTGEEVLIFNLPKFGVAIAARVNHIGRRNCASQQCAYAYDIAVDKVFRGLRLSRQITDVSTRVTAATTLCLRTFGQM